MREREREREREMERDYWGERCHMLPDTPPARPPKRTVGALRFGELLVEPLLRCAEECVCGGRAVAGAVSAEGGRG